MIDPKSFMEFFEKEYGVKFVNANTGEDVLNKMRQKQVCANCRHIIRSDGENLHAGDMVCGNPESDYLSDFRPDDDTCIYWEKE